MVNFQHSQVRLFRRIRTRQRVGFNAAWQNVKTVTRDCFTRKNSHRPWIKWTLPQTQLNASVPWRCPKTLKKPWWHSQLCCKPDRKANCEARVCFRFDETMSWRWAAAREAFCRTRGETTCVGPLWSAFVNSFLQLLCYMRNAHVNVHIQLSQTTLNIATINTFHHTCSRQQRTSL